MDAWDAGAASGCSADLAVATRTHVLQLAPCPTPNTTPAPTPVMSPSTAQTLAEAQIPTPEVVLTVASRTPVLQLAPCPTPNTTPAPTPVLAPSTAQTLAEAQMPAPEVALTTTPPPEPTATLKPELAPPTRSVLTTALVPETTPAPALVPTATPTLVHQASFPAESVAEGDTEHGANHRASAHAFDESTGGEVLHCDQLHIAVRSNDLPGLEKLLALNRDGEFACTHSLSECRVV